MTMFSPSARSMNTPALTKPSIHEFCCWNRLNGTVDAQR
jgi:hypothetical protein